MIRTESQQLFEPPAITVEAENNNNDRTSAVQIMENPLPLDPNEANNSERNIGSNGSIENGLGEHDQPILENINVQPLNVQQENSDQENPGSAVDRVILN